jgi:hypothetical protein
VANIIEKESSILLMAVLFYELLVCGLERGGRKVFLDNDDKTRSSRADDTYSTSASTLAMSDHPSGYFDSPITRAYDDV